jgi:hypothetical protein
MDWTAGSLQTMNVWTGGPVDDETMDDMVDQWMVKDGLLDHCRQ